MLSTVPPEVLLGIVDHLSRGSVAALLRTNRRNRDVIEPYLYREDARGEWSDALLWASSFSMEMHRRDTLPTARKALAAGADPDGSPCSKGFGKPIQKACLSGNEALVKLLLATGEINLSDEIGHYAYGRKTWPLFHFAVISGVVGVGKLLLDAGCNPSAEDQFCDTPLHMAAAGTRLEFAKFLVETCGVDIYAKNIFGQTPFQRAGYFQSAEALAWFLENTYQSRESINKTWEEVVREANIEMMQMLLDRGADIDTRFTIDEGTATRETDALALAKKGGLHRGG